MNRIEMKKLRIRLLLCFLPNEIAIMRTYFRMR